MPVPPLSTTHRKVVMVLLGAWVTLLVVALLGPSAAGPSWLVGTLAGAGDAVGVPAVVTGQTEFALNVVAFVPVSLLGSLLWPRPTWRDWTAYGFVASFGVEAFQAVFLSARSATHADVVSNTLGALAGAVLAVAFVQVRERTPSEGRADLPDRSSPTEQDQLPG